MEQKQEEEPRVRTFTVPPREKKEDEQPLSTPMYEEIGV